MDGNSLGQACNIFVNSHGSMTIGSIAIKCIYKSLQMETGQQQNSAGV